MKVKKRVLKIIPDAKTAVQEASTIIQILHRAWIEGIWSKIQPAQGKT